jgi:hypothetical protein
MYYILWKRSSTLTFQSSGDRSSRLEIARHFRNSKRHPQILFHVFNLLIHLLSLVSNSDTFLFQSLIRNIDCWTTITAGVDSWFSTVLTNQVNGWTINNTRRKTQYSILSYGLDCFQRMKTTNNFAGIYPICAARPKVDNQESGDES